jgi:transcriptional regulator of acetoin/glycerol metabolism
VGLFAGAIENRLLVAQAKEHLVVYLQVAPSLLDSPLVGIVGVDGTGRVAWSNGVASRLLGLDSSQLVANPPPVEAALGLGVGALASLPTHGSAVMKLPSGLTVWVRATMQACDGRRELFSLCPVGPSTAVPASLTTEPSVSGAEGSVDTTVSSSLRELDRDLIAQTLQACRGNVSRAAKQLHVSRGLIYRRLRELRQQDDSH